MLRTFCRTGSVRVTDGRADPLNALRLHTREGSKLLVCTELLQTVLVIFTCRCKQIVNELSTECYCVCDESKWSYKRGHADKFYGRIISLKERSRSRGADDLLTG